MLIMNSGDNFASSVTLKNKRKLMSGFTLVELMVVIGIIGILVSVILTQIVPAVTKGSDTAIKADLNAIQSQASIEFLNLGRKFSGTGVAIVASPGFTPADCALVTTANTIFANPQIQASMAQIKDQNGGVAITCIVTANGTAYAIAVTMASGKFWCIDSTGVSKGAYGTGTTAYSGQYNNSTAYAIAWGANVCS